MFMFRRRRRSALVKSLLKARLRKRDEPSSTVDEVRDILMKALGISELEELTRAVETRGCTATCVLIDHPQGDPAFLSCRAWRWPEMSSSVQLKKLPMCKSSQGFICFNPYHWCRLYIPETPPPPYSRFCSESLKPEDRAPSESSQLELRGSLSTNGDGDVPSGWCRLAYWELSTRVGRQFPVFDQSVNVFWNIPHGDGLSLEALACKQPPPPSTVLKARDKIGKGVTLSKEEDGVWAFNRSDLPIFVNSPSLDDPDSRYYLVYRIPPGHCLNIYTGPPIAPLPRFQTGPVDPNSVRISFAKGWGPKYSRQEITACPVWIEVLLAPYR